MGPLAWVPKSVPIHNLCQPELIPRRLSPSARKMPTCRTLSAAYFKRLFPFSCSFCLGLRLL
jgi:hypothetical protein